jgi:hypothetical protein
MLAAVSLLNRSSIVRKKARGVTILPSAEGPSLRSDPRWTRAGVLRAERLIDRLIALKRAPLGT